MEATNAHLLNQQCTAKGRTVVLMNRKATTRSHRTIATDHTFCHRRLRLRTVRITDIISKLDEEPSLRSFKGYRSFDRAMIEFNANKHVEDDTTDDGDQQYGRSGAINVSHHSEVEKRRRDRMNSLLNQLALLVPSAANKKYDKLTVLRLTLQYINTLQNSSLNDLTLFGSSSSMTYKDLRAILHKSGEHVLMMASTQTAEVMYVGENISEMLSMTAECLCNRSWIDILHPDDIKPFLKFICFEGDLAATEVDSAEQVSLKNPKAANGVEQIPPSQRKSVVVRIVNNPTESERRPDMKDYVTIECHMAMRNPQMKVSLIIARPVRVNAVQSYPFTIVINNISRIQRVDNIISHVIDRVSHDLIGTSYYDLIYDGDLLTVSQLQKSVQASSTQKIATYRIRSSTGTFVTTTAVWKAVSNPFTNSVQFITIKHFPRMISLKNEQDIRQSTLKQMLHNHNETSKDNL
uniref:BHLH domain-containing protein n=1 Tax=Steinernema glaseri TaxID=37863 RepID=A0A1I7ZU17_9BILA